MAAMLVVKKKVFLSSGNTLKKKKKKKKKGRINHQHGRHVTWHAKNKPNRTHAA